MSQDDIQEIAMTINLTPRKCLVFRPFAGSASTDATGPDLPFAARRYAAPQFIKARSTVRATMIDTWRMPLRRIPVSITIPNAARPAAGPRSSLSRLTSPPSEMPQPS